MGKAQSRKVRFGGLSNNLAENVESADNAWASFNCWHDGGVLEGMRRYRQIGRRTSFASGDVGYGLGYGKTSVNEIQKLVMSGSPTGGTWTITFSGQTATGVKYNTTAAELQAKLEGLSNIDVGDVIVTGGPFPYLPIEVMFTGAYATTDVSLMTDNSAGLTGGSSPDVSITEYKKGGEFEVIYAVVKHSGDTDANLYAVTSTDGFATTTWTSLATDFAASDWHFEQFGDRMFMANSADGLKWIFIGSSAIGSTTVLPPGTAPTAVESIPAAADQYMVTSATTWAQTGLGTAPTLTAGDGTLQVKFNATESNVNIVLTGTLAADKDWSLGRDVGRFIFQNIGQGAVSLDMTTAKIEIINADASPVTIVPDHFSRVLFASNFLTFWRWFHFADKYRDSRDNIHKVVLRIKGSVELNDECLINFDLGKTWPNDTRALTIDPPNGLLDPEATTAAIEYAYSYYDISADAESGLSPIGFSGVVPSSAGDGCSVTLTAIGSSALNTTDDRVFFYRREKGSLKWRRLPNTATPLGPASYGATNATGSSPTMNDTWMEHELASFPEPGALGFPPQNTGATADVLGVWKQTLDVGSKKLAYLSWVGQPLRYEPSPDTVGYVSPDPDEFPDVGVTEYVSDNRSEDVYALKGQDSLYAVTNLSSYAKVGNTPATGSVFRRLPGSRGCVGKRACTRYGGGIWNMAQDGLWYYSVNTGFKGEDSGSLFEREETGGDIQAGVPGIRRSYQRLLSELQSARVTGTYSSGDTFTLTVNGKTTTDIAMTATPHQVRLALEDLDIINRGDIEVFGTPLIDEDGLPGGVLYFRFLQQFKQTNVDALTMATSTARLTADVRTDSVGGSSNDTIIVEFNDECWMFNKNNYLVQSQNRTWVEGAFRDTVKAVIPERNRGLIFLTSVGALMRFTEGDSTDNGGEVTWQYETPWLTDERARIIGLRAEVTGNPNITIYADDGAGSVDAYGTTSPHMLSVWLEEKKYQPLGAAMLPAIRHKLVITGVSGRDSVKSLNLIVQPEAQDAWGS